MNGPNEPHFTDAKNAETKEPLLPPTGNVRHKAEIVADTAAKNMGIFREIERLTKNLHESDAEMERQVNKYIESGILKLNRCYLTNKGVLAIVMGDDGRVAVTLLPLANNCDHAAVPKPKDDAIPF